MERKISFAENEFYHLYNRGVDKRKIYLSASDYRRFLALLYLANSTAPAHLANLLRGKQLKDLSTITREHPLVAIGAFCLMPNHFHILLTPLVEHGISKFMLKLETGYSMYFNKKYERSGALFQGKFKAEHASSDNYLKYLYAYIHLNPARAKWISVGQERLSRYRWSSYPFYLKGVLQRPGWLVTGRVMGNLGLRPEERDGYEAYMEGRVIELGVKAGRTALNEQWKRIRRGWYLGDDGFRGRMLKYVKETLGNGRPTTYSGEAKRAHGQEEAQRLLGLGLAALKVGDRQLQDGAKGMPEKQALAWWLCQKTTVARRWVCERLGMGDESRVSKAIRRMKEGRDSGLAKLKERLEKTEKEANSFANE